MDFDVKIIPPVTYTEATVVLKEGEHFYLSGYEGIDNWGSLNYEMAQKYRNITKLKIVGKIDFYDFNFFRENYWIAANIRLLDLSEAQFVRDRTNQSGGLDNVFPARALYNPQLGGCQRLKKFILPSTLHPVRQRRLQGVQPPERNQTARKSTLLETRKTGICRNSQGFNKRRPSRRCFPGMQFS